MTRVRLKFPQGDPIEFPLEQVRDYGPPVPGFRAWLGAVSASSDGRWLIRFSDERLLGFRRAELRRIRLGADGAELTLGGAGEERVVPIVESEVVSYGPEPEGPQAWLGRLAHGSGEAWIRLADGRELRFAMGDGPHVAFLDPRDVET